MTILISNIEGNHQSLDGGSMFGNVPRVVWEHWHHPDAQGRIRLSCRGLLLEVGPTKILCETGIGAFFEPKLRSRFGVEGGHELLASLRQLGLDHSDIDAVILSHLHFDHAGGLLPSYEDIAAGNKGLLFPKARYIVGRQAFERAEHPHPRDRASFIPGLTELLRASERLTLVDNQGVIPDFFPDRLRFIFTSGHTPGHMHTLFRGDKGTVFFAGDLAPGTAWVHLPVTMGYDRFAEQVIDEKKQIFDQAIAEHWSIFYTHDPDFPLSTIEFSSGKYQATQTQNELTRRPL